jgi:hypothetical protein
MTFPSSMKELPFRVEALQIDLTKILQKASLRRGSIKLQVEDSLKENSVQIQCVHGNFELHVRAIPGERAATFYKGLRQLGFLFPHPRVQISPTLEQMRRACGQTYLWKPTLRMRGLHLHTLHPSEWVHGFFLDSPRVAEEMVRWLARNGQNVLDLSLLRIPLPILKEKVSPHFKLAQSFEIHTGVSIGTATQQQKTYKLLNLFEALTGFGADRKIEAGLNALFAAIPLSFIVIEAGTSEFTPTSYEKTLAWLNLSGKIAKENEIVLFTKIHVSSNQTHEKWGNFNFLPQYSSANVGIWPHTVMFYGLLDQSAPMYGNKSFEHIKGFMEAQKSKRPTWYYPETGYWIGMDQDVPLFLTDYLRTRSEDMNWLSENHYEGQANFSTGHALGGWLWDWNLALMTDADYHFDPFTTLTLLGEDVEVWQRILDFQKTWFKDRNLIAYLSAANLQDELSSHRIHERMTMKELSNNLIETRHEVEVLERGLKEWPGLAGVKNLELRTLLEITQLRHRHALELRRAILGDKKIHLDQAQSHRLEAMEKIEGLSKLETNYPELPLFEKHRNPTSYQFGYVYLASSTYFWKREETQIRTNSFFPFTENIIDVWEILF